MNAPERSKRLVLRAGGMDVVRTGSIARFRKIAREIRAAFPKAKKGESVTRELRELRLRGGRV